MIVCDKESLLLIDYQNIRDFKSWEGVFRNQNLLKVDIGCGKDDSLIQKALSEPTTNFIGIENDRGMAARLSKKVARSGVSNIRIISFEAQFVLKNLFSSASVQSFFLQFPDPWPKRRHSRRRVLSEEFVRDILEKLVTRGDLFIATDVSDIAKTALELIQKTGSFEEHKGKKPYSFQTLYERKFLEQGLPIYYLWFKKATV